MNNKPFNFKYSDFAKSKHLQYAFVLLLLVLICGLVYMLGKTAFNSILLVCTVLLLLFLVFYDLKCRHNFFALCKTFHIMQILFDTYFDNGTVAEALKEVGCAIDADSVYFILRKKDVNINNYKYKSGKSSHLSLSFEEQAKFVSALENYRDGKTLYLKKNSRWLNKEAAKIAEEHGIHSMVVVKEKASELHMSGFLIAVNSRKKMQECHFEYTANLLLISAIRLYRIEKLEKTGKFDFLTGLSNRNSYQTAIANYKKTPVQGLACIYMDLNGLHNINNRFGHEKGDYILCCTANTLINYFGSTDVYRIGGDEFVVIHKYESTKDLNEKLRRMRQELFVKGCSVSIGVELCENGSDIEAVIKSAEEKMFKEKNTRYKDEKRI